MCVWENKTRINNTDTYPNNAIGLQRMENFPQISRKNTQGKKNQMLFKLCSVTSMPELGGGISKEHKGPIFKTFKERR